MIRVAPTSGVCKKILWGVLQAGNTITVSSGGFYKKGATFTDLLKKNLKVKTFCLHTLVVFWLIFNLGFDPQNSTMHTSIGIHNFDLNLSINFHAKKMQ